MNNDSMNIDVECFPAKLPPAERVLWQGRPSWRALALHGFHLRWFAAYFALLLAWYAATVFTSPATTADAAVATLRMTGIALVPLALICIYAWMTAVTTIYTITDRRVVMRIGIALPISFNLPFSQIASAGLKIWSNGHGDLTLSLAAEKRMAYFVFWPHVRPWRMKHTEPMLRCVPEAEHVAQTLARALAISADMAVPSAPAGIAASAGAGPHAPALA
jgi:hypothetical protein